MIIIVIVNMPVLFIIQPSIIKFLINKLRFVFWLYIRYVQKINLRSKTKKNASSHSCQVTKLSISKTDIEEVITKFYFWYQMNISKLIDLYFHWKDQKIIDFKLIFKKWNLETMPYIVLDDKWSREALKVAQSYPSLQQCFQ